MLLDGGKLKEIKIKLYLSSRTEMLKVIEQARQQAIKLQALVVAPPVQQINQPLVPEVVKEEPPKVENPEKPEETHKSKDDDGNNRRDRRDRSSSRDRSRRGRSKDNDRNRDRSRGRDRRDRERDRRRRDRSRSRDRYRSRRSKSRDRKRSSREESKEQNKGNKHSRDSDTDKNEVSNGKNENSNSQSWETQKQQPNKSNVLPDPPAIPQMLLQMQQNGKDPIPSAPVVSQAQPVPPQVPPMNFPTEQDRRQFEALNQIPPQMPPNFPGMHPFRGRENWSLPTPLGMGPMPLIDPSQLQMQRPMMMPTDMPFPPPTFPPQAMYPTPMAINQMWRVNVPTENHSENSEDKVTGYCIEIRGLPLNASYIDIKKLFDGLTIPSDGIKMINDTQGNRTGIAYARFSSPSQKKSALNQNGSKVRSNVVEVISLREDLFDAAVDNFKPEKEGKAIDMDLDNGESIEDDWSRHAKRERGRERKFQDPYRTNSNSEFKKNDPRQDISRRDKRPEINRHDPRFDSRHDSRFDPRQESRTDQRLEQREESRQEPRPEVRIDQRGEIRSDPRQETRLDPRQEVRPDPRQESRQDPRHEARPDPRQEVRPDPRQEARPDPRPDPRQERSSRIDRQERSERAEKQEKPERPERLSRPERQEREDTNTILIKGLPHQCNEEDILELFSDSNVMPLNLELHLNEMGQFIGEATCSFKTKEESEQALSKNGTNMGRFVISVEMVSEEEIKHSDKHWNRNFPPAEGHSAPLLPLPYPYRVHPEEMNDRIPAYGVVDERYMMQDRRPYGAPERFGGRFRGDGEPNMRGSMRGGRGVDGRMGGMRGRSRFGPLLPNDRGEHPMQNPINMRGPPSRGGGRHMGPVPAPNSSFVDNEVVEHFGKPGCVVALDNIHFRAEIDEIIALFSDFDVDHEDVIRRFDERGRATGDARVCFKSHAEALRAVRQLAYAQIRGRTINFSLL